MQAKVEEFKEMLVDMKRQLDRIEEKQEEMLRDGKLIGSVESGGKQEEVTQEDKEGKTDEKTSISSIIKKFGGNNSEDSSDDEEDEVEEDEEEEDEDDEEEEKGSGERGRMGLVAMAGGSFLIGGALYHHSG